MYWETIQGSTCFLCLIFSVRFSFYRKWINPHVVNVSCFCIKVAALCMNQLGLSNFTSEHSALHDIIIQQCILYVSPGAEIFDNRTNSTKANDNRRSIV